MYARLCGFLALLYAGPVLSGCVGYAPYPCPPGYHLGPYGRRRFHEAFTWRIGRALASKPDLGNFVWMSDA